MRRKKVNYQVIPLKKPSRVSLLVGLTGGFGTGKSTVARFFRRLSAKVIDSDRLVHQALRPGSATYRAICDHFGRKNVLVANGMLDRRKLARLVFENSRKRKILESIVHPYVFSEIARLAKETRGVLILEVPLLFETRFDREMDVTIVVRANRKNQMARLAKKGSMTPREVRSRIRSQWPLERKVARADFVISNDGSLSETMKQVKSIWKQLKTMMREEKVNG